MINTMLQQKFHIVLCFRGKEKLKIVKGKDPVNMGWRPIASDRIHFETAFTLILPPNSKGVPDLSVEGSELRSPFNTMIKHEEISESLGLRLAEWAKGGTAPAPVTEPIQTLANMATKDQINHIIDILKHQKGITEKIKILAELSTFYGRGIGSSKELTAEEADRFINANEKLGE